MTRQSRFLSVLLIAGLLTGMLTLTCNGLPIVRFRVNPDDDKATLKARYAGLVTFLERQDLKVDFDVVNSYEELRDQLANGSVDLAVLSPLNYVNTRKNLDVDLLARLAKYGAPAYGTVIIAPTQDVPDVSTLSDWTFLYFNTSSTSGYMAPLEVLAARGVHIDAARMKQIQGSHPEVIDAISKGRHVFGATSTDKLKEARARSPDLTVYPILRGPEDIPFDAVVLSPKADMWVQKACRKAIGTLLLLVEEDLRQVFPEGAAVSGLISAEDSDYDGLRRMWASTHGRGTIRFGLSLGVEPNVRFTKRAQFGRLQALFLRTQDQFLDLVKVYPTDDADELLTALETGVIDVGELPPVAAGHGLAKGFRPLATPVFDGQGSYAAVLIERRTNAPIRYPDGVRGLKIAVLPADSASGRIYRIHDLASHGIAEREVTLIERSDFEGVVRAVVGQQADVGAVALFQLHSARALHLPAAAEVEEVKASSIQIPNGAYLVSPKFKADDRAINDLLGRLTQAANSLELRPSYAALAHSDADKMAATYLEAFPKDRSLLYLFIVAGVCIAFAGVVFLWWYVPAKLDDAQLENE